MGLGKGKERFKRFPSSMARRGRHPHEHWRRLRTSEHGAAAAVRLRRVQARHARPQAAQRRARHRVDARDHVHGRRRAGVAACSRAPGARAHDKLARKQSAASLALPSHPCGATGRLLFPNFAPLPPSRPTTFFPCTLTRTGVTAARAPPQRPAAARPAATARPRPHHGEREEGAQALRRAERGAPVLVLVVVGRAPQAAGAHAAARPGARRARALRRGGGGTALHRTGEGQGRGLQSACSTQARTFSKSQARQAKPRGRTLGSRAFALRGALYAR